MKKLLLTFGIFFSALLGVQAQQTSAPTAAQQIEKIMKTLTATCNLTADQVTKAKPIITEFVNARIANKQKFGSDKEKLKEANEASKKARDTKLATVLTADQQKQLAAKEKEMATSPKEKASGN